MIEKIFENSLYKNHREMMLCFFDLCIVFVSFLLAYWIKIEFRIPNFEDIYIGNFALAMLSVLLVYMIIILIMLGLLKLNVIFKLNITMIDLTALFIYLLMNIIMVDLILTWVMIVEVYI